MGEAGLIVVEMAGVCLLTVRGSHEALTLLLLESPPYVALNAKLPVAEGVTELEMGTELPAPTITVEVEAGEPTQRLLVKNAYTTLPVTPTEGNPPVRVAWSVTEAPTVIVEDGRILVVIDGVCLVTVRGLQELLMRVLFASPLYVALNAKEPAEGGAIALEAGTKLPALTVTIDEEIGVPKQDPLPKNA